MEWEYKLIADGTDSKLWERQIIEIFNPNKAQRQKIVIGNIYRPLYNLRDTLNTFMGEFNATLLENNANSQNTYMCGDYNVDLLKLITQSSMTTIFLIFCLLDIFQKLLSRLGYQKAVR